jgi:hypothetical protein
MPSDNGWAWAAKWLAGAVLSVVLFVALPTMATNIIANDKESRIRDGFLDEKYQRKCDEQQKVNESIVVALAEIKTDLKYIKEKVK